MEILRVVFFDLDGTLVRIIPNKAIAKYIEFIKLLDSSSSNDNIKRAYVVAHSKWKKIKNTLIGRKKYIELWRLCLEELNIKGDKYSLACELQTHIESECDELYPDVIKTLRILHRKGFFLGILSDRPKITIEKALSRHNISGFFNAYISAFELDPIKGKLNPIVWKKLTEIAGRPSCNILYIGDDYSTDIEPALRHGINAILINRKRIYNNAQDNYIVIKHLGGANRCF